MDMEFFQFHPTGIAGKGMLITEGVRGEGGFLINKHGERFMERYAPNAKDLASRDVVARAIVTEVKEGRGCGPDSDHVLLKLDHLGEEVISKRLPGIRESARIFAGVDPVHEPIPVFPTAHYVMGGIPTDMHGRVVVPLRHGPEEVVPGLYAAGECACVSVHGANRLGGNSLLDILVFGRAAGLDITGYLKENPNHRPLDEAAVDKAMSRLLRWDQKGEGPSVRDVRDEFRKCMEDHAGVFRTEEIMAEGVEKVKAIRDEAAGRPPDGPQQGVQHRACRGAGAGESDRCRHGARHVRPPPQGKPRRSLASRLPRARRRELAQAQSLLPRGRSHGLQAGAHQAADAWRPFRRSRGCIK